MGLNSYQLKIQPCEESHIKKQNFIKITMLHFFIKYDECKNTWGRMFDSRFRRIKVTWHYRHFFLYLDNFQNYNNKVHHSWIFRTCSSAMIFQNNYWQKKIVYIIFSPTFYIYVHACASSIWIDKIIVFFVCFFLIKSIFHNMINHNKAFLSLDIWENWQMTQERSIFCRHI